MRTRQLQACALLAALPGVATPAPPLEAELVGAFFETEQVDVAVSGSVVVGVTSTSVQGGKSVGSLLLLHAAGDPQVCLTMLSRDGVYYSRNTFRLPDAGAGQAVRLPYRTNLRDRLGNYEAADLAIRANAGSCEFSTNLYYVLGSASDQAPGAIRVFVAPSSAQPTCSIAALHRASKASAHPLPRVVVPVSIIGATSPGRAAASVWTSVSSGSVTAARCRR